MQLVSKIRLGDSATLLFDAYQDATGKVYASGAYALDYYVNGNELTAPVHVTGTANGTGWKVVLAPTLLSAANVAAYPTKPYQWSAVLSASGERLTAWSGDLTVLPDLTASDPKLDARTQEEIDFEAIKAAISARIANGTPLEYTIGNRSLKNEPLAALIALRDRYALIVAKQKAAAQQAAGLGNPGRVMVAFR